MCLDRSKDIAMWRLIYREDELNIYFYGAYASLPFARNSPRITPSPWTTECVSHLNLGKTTHIKIVNLLQNLAIDILLKSEAHNAREY
jgi:hypothetical protein